MATIDKPLPNTKTTVEVPGEVEIQESIKENVDIIKQSISSQNIDFFEMKHAPHSLFRINEESDLLFKACSDFIKKNI